MYALKMFPLVFTRCVIHLSQSFIFIVACYGNTYTNAYNWICDIFIWLLFTIIQWSPTPCISVVVYNILIDVGYWYLFNDNAISEYMDVLGHLAFLPTM